MIRFRLFYLVSAMGAASLARAAGAPPLASPAPASPAVRRKAPAPKAPATSPLSPGIAAMLAASMPKYDPPKPPPKGLDQEVDLREVDKPKNKIVRLPNFVVHAEKPPIFREQDLYSKSGLAKLALARYEGLSA
ncbi:MAG: hypothetical protein ACREFX_01455, partial [Opitutaceae bacterium]